MNLQLYKKFNKCFSRTLHAKRLPCFSNNVPKREHWPKMVHISDIIILMLQGCDLSGLKIACMLHSQKNEGVAVLECEKKALSDVPGEKCTDKNAGIFEVY